MINVTNNEPASGDQEQYANERGFYSRTVDVHDLYTLSSALTRTMTHQSSRLQANAPSAS